MHHTTTQLVTAFISMRNRKRKTKLTRKYWHWQVSVRHVAKSFVKALPGFVLCIFSCLTCPEETYFQRAGRYQPGCTKIFWPAEGTSQPVTISKKWKNSQFCSTYSGPSPILKAQYQQLPSMLSEQSLGERDIDTYFELTWRPLTSPFSSILFLCTFS
jgi:hypothetical protein